MNRLLGICHADVNMHPEHELLTRDEAERVHETPVAIVADDALLLPAGEGMSARGADLEVLPARPVARDLAQGCQLRSRRGDVRAWRGRDLEHRLQELGLDLPRRGVRAQDRVDPADEAE